MSEQFEPTEYARVRAEQNNLAPLLIEVDTYTKRMAAALEAAHAARRAERDEAVAQRFDASVSWHGERAGRERAEADAAAMRGSVEALLVEVQRMAFDGGGFSCTVVDEARAALATDTGSALLAAHRAEVERLTDLRDSAAHRAIKDRDAARAQLAERTAERDAARAVARAWSNTQLERADAAEARAARLLAALEPFAERAAHYDGIYAETTIGSDTAFTVGHLRAARAARDGVGDPLAVMTAAEDAYSAGRGGGG